MQVNTQAKTYVNTLETEQKGFGIEMNGVAFLTLSKNLYSDKMAAAIREVSCNALDAHTAAGKPDMPIQAHLPTEMEPYFSVRDEGTGMPFDKVENLYTTYFASSKRDTDNEIGGFGLGSKAPFAYGNQFTVEARWNGEIRQYICSMDVAGRPSIQLMSSAPTTEVNGITVKFAVRTSDIYEFRAKATRIYQWFDVKPDTNITLSYQNAEPWDSGNGWATYKELITAGMYLLQGNVLYRLDHEQLNSGELKLLNTNLVQRDFALVFTAPIGTVPVNPNREVIEYNPQSIKVINSLADVFKTEIGVATRQEVEQAPSYYEARKLWIQRVKGTILQDYGVKGRWRGRKIYSKRDSEGNETPIPRWLSRYIRFKTKPTRINISAWNTLEQWRPDAGDEYKITYILELDVDGRYPENQDLELLRYNFPEDSSSIGQSSWNRTLVICGSEKRLLAVLKARAPEAKYVKLSELTELPKAVREPSLSYPYEVVLKNTNRSSDYYYDKVHVKVREQSGFFYEISRFHSTKTERIDRLTDFNPSKYPKDMRVYGVQRSKIKPFRRSENWIDLDAEFKKEREAYKNTKDFRRWVKYVLTVEQMHHSDTYPFGYGTGNKKPNQGHKVSRAYIWTNMEQRRVVMPNEYREVVSAFHRQKLSYGKKLKALKHSLSWYAEIYPEIYERLTAARDNATVRWKKWTDEHHRELKLISEYSAKEDMMQLLIDKGVFDYDK